MLSKSQTLLNISKTQQHPFHVLNLSRLPAVMAGLAGGLALTIVAKLQNITNFSTFVYVADIIAQPFFSLNGVCLLKTPTFADEVLDARILQFLVLILLTLWAWGRELVKEATFEGYHTSNVVVGLKYGMLLFLVSEAMLFFPFFWAFFHASLSPSINVGGIWPPEGIHLNETLDAFMLPLVNTVVLLSSGVALVAAHRAMIAGCKTIVLQGLYVAVTLGILFSWLQYLEYGLTKYTLIDGMYGSTFFMLTGLHGFHVVVGTCLLLISYWRTAQNHFSRQHHALFEFSAWYWHFVDVVWLFVFAFVYCWGVDMANA